MGIPFRLYIQFRYKDTLNQFKWKRKSMLYDLNLNFINLGFSLQGNPKVLEYLKENIPKDMPRADSLRLALNVSRAESEVLEIDNELATNELASVNAPSSPSCLPLPFPKTPTTPSSVLAPSDTLPSSTKPTDPASLPSGAESPFPNSSSSTSITSNVPNQSAGLTQNTSPISPTLSATPAAAAIIASTSGSETGRGKRRRQLTPSCLPLPLPKTPTTPSSVVAPSDMLPSSTRPTDPTSSPSGVELPLPNSSSATSITPDQSAQLNTSPISPAMSVTPAAAAAAVLASAAETGRGKRRRQPKSTHEEEDHEGEYEVESLLEFQRNSEVGHFSTFVCLIQSDIISLQGDPEYLVKWKGYSNDHNSWVGEDALQYVTLLRYRNYILMLTNIQELSRIAGFIQSAAQD